MTIIFIATGIAAFAAIAFRFTGHAAHVPGKVENR
jgi:hypothetical protein